MIKKENKILNKEELKAKIIEEKKKLFALRLKKSSGELDKTSEIGKLKKEIARLFTKLNKK
jgi:large subunit ribosomal protein L29